MGLLDWVDGEKKKRKKGWGEGWGWGGGVEEEASKQLAFPTQSVSLSDA